MNRYNMQFVNIRKKLHTIAEIARNEKETAEFIAGQLRQIGFTDIQENIGGYGLIATVKGEEEGPSVLFRAELDALPIEETINIPHASQNKGISHKCGHDGHMTILLGLAHELNKRPVRKGKVHLLFQPAEETGEGADLMLKDEKMSGYKPDYLFALHNLPGYPLHSVLLRSDVFAAGSAGLIVRLKGRTSHAAHPEHGISPASAVASLIQEWQSLPQSVIPLDRSGLLTVIHARIGSPDFGTSPGYAELMATIRAHDQDDLDKLGKRAVELADTTATSWKLKIEHEWTEVFKPTLNDSDATALIENAVNKLQEEDGNNNFPVEYGINRISDISKALQVIKLNHPFSWSEDFGRFTEKWPGALFGLGAGTDHPKMHDAKYDFPDELLETGILLFSGIIDELGLR